MPGAAATGLNSPVNLPVPSASQLVQQTIAAAASGLPVGAQNGMTVGNGIPAQQPWNAGASGGGSARSHWLAPGVQQAMHQLSVHAQNVMHAAQNRARSTSTGTGGGPDAVNYQHGEPQPGSGAGPSTARPASNYHHQATVAASDSSSASASPNAAMNAITGLPLAASPTPITAPGLAAVAVAAPQQQQFQHHPPPQQNLRVFRLQFDARKLVCCSQDSRIIGWDFANGDPDIEAASRFF